MEIFVAVSDDNRKTRLTLDGDLDLLDRLLATIGTVRNERGLLQADASTPINMQPAPAPGGNYEAD